MMTVFEATLRQAATDLDGLRARWAMIGGVAVSARSSPRFTKDVDFQAAVTEAVVDNQKRTTRWRIASSVTALGSTV